MNQFKIFRMNKVVLILAALVLSLLTAEAGSVWFSWPQDIEVNDNIATVFGHLPDRNEMSESLNFVDLDLVLDSVILASNPRSALDAATSSDEITIEDSPAKIDPAAISVRLRCIQTAEGYKRIASGTGFLINDSGVFLTNAHVAQFLLLRDITELGETECLASVGNSESYTHTVELLYISPTWLLEHASLIASTAPKGTGESDFALV